MALRCLIVDDSPVFLRAARALLEREGVAVTVASTGAEALRLVQDLDPQVVLVDIDLGDESGFDLVLRLSGGTRVPRLILISSHSAEDFQELIVDSPAAGFLSKSRLSAAAIRSMMAAGG